MNNKVIYLIFGVIVLSVVAVVAMLHDEEAPVTPPSVVINQQPVVPVQSSPASTTPDLSEYAGVIATSTSGMSTYTSSKYGFRLSYPQSWSVVANRLGNYDTFLLRNYQYDSDQKGFGVGQNEIQIAIVNSGSPYEPVSDYPEKHRDVKEIVIKDRLGTRYNIELIGGENSRGYLFPLSSTPGKFVAITTKGDPTNFHVLDELVQGIEWTQ
jgi:hypothetical protein